MRREVPLLLTVVFGILMIVDFFVPHPFIADWAQRFRDWAIIIIAFSFFLGVANLIKINAQKVSRREAEWPFAAVLLAGLFVTIFLGITFGIADTGGIRGVFNRIFLYMYTPMQATMFSLLAFYIASAAFRSFRVRSFEATLLAVTAVIVMIGRVPIGNAISEALHLPDGLTFGSVQAWIMDFPNLAAKRAILIGAALGSIATGLKIVLGIERNYLGEGGAGR
jgi:uncharacterized membrane protein YozB (DUF420 family)